MSIRRIMKIGRQVAAINIRKSAKIEKKIRINAIKAKKILDKIIIYAFI